MTTPLLRQIILKFSLDLETDPKFADLLAFTPHQDANNLILNNPGAFLYGAIADQQMKAERAWELPYKLKQRLGHLDPFRIGSMDQDSLHMIIEDSPSLHRHPYRMAGFLIQSSKHLCDYYGGRADRIWCDQPTASDLQERLCQFSGVNQKISSMIIGLLCSHFQVPIRDLHESEVAVDRHVRRVLFRTGVADGSLNGAIEAGKNLNGENPAQIDFALFWIGKLFCHIVDPDCGNCPLTSACGQRIKADLVVGLSEIQKTKRVVEKAAQEQIRFLERLERSMNSLSVRETQQGKLHYHCKYHGKSCPHKGERGHPVKILLRTKDKVIHVRKQDVDQVVKLVDNGQREIALRKALRSCNRLQDIVEESLNLFESVEQLYDDEG